MGNILTKSEARLENMAYQFEVYEDFYEFTTGDLFSSLAADSGATVAVGDAAGGIITLTTGATNNNEAAVFTTKEVFKFANNKPFSGVFRVQYTEAATNAANVFIGFADAIGADLLIDDGGGTKSSYSGACFYKVDGGTVWICQSSVGTTRTTTTLNAAGSRDGISKTAGGSSYSVFRIDVVSTSSTEAQVSFFIDGILVAVHSLTVTSATEMQAGVYVKAGTAASQTTLVDYSGLVAVR